MGRKHQWPPKARPHRPSGRDRVRWMGHDYYLGPIGSAASRRAYLTLLNKLEAEGVEKPAPPDVTTVGRVCSEWGPAALKKYGADNPECLAYEAALRPLLAMFADLPADGFGDDELEAVRDRMVAAGNCRNVCNRRTSRIRTVWRWGGTTCRASRTRKKKLVPKGAWAHLRSLPPLARGENGVRETRRVRPAEWPAVVAVCRRVNPSVRGLLLAQWFTGARPGELMRMVVGDLVEDCGVGTHRPAQHKNAWRGHERVVQFGPRALAAVRKLLEGKRRITRELGLDAARSALGQASIMTTDRYAAGGDEKTAGDVARKCG